MSTPESIERLLIQYKVDDVSKLPLKAIKREMRIAKEESKKAQRQLKIAQRNLDDYWAAMERLANMKYDEFYEEAFKANFPDEMVFQINRENPDPTTTFSEEGVDGVINKIKAFTLARTHGHWQREGVSPQSLKVHVKLEWGDMSPEEALEAGGRPWYNVMDLPQLDGGHRLMREE